VALSEEADDIARAIDDQGEQANDVAAEHAHVYRFQVGNRGILAMKDNLAPPFLTTEADLCFDDDRPYCSPHAPDTLLGGNGLETECFEDWGAEDRTVCTRIHQKWRLHPGAISRQNSPPNDRPDSTVIEQ
jgi:hypothetical protein